MQTLHLGDAEAGRRLSIAEAEAIAPTKAAPLFDDVVRNVEIPRLLPATLPKPEPAMDEALRQGATFGRIADALEYMVALGQQNYLQREKFLAVQEDALWWAKLLSGIVILAPILIALFMWATSL